MTDTLLQQARIAFRNHDQIYWIVGGAGSGKTTICQNLSAKFDIPIYDMDAHIYGVYHGRFTQERHPINKMWATAPNGLAWLLNKSWDEFDNFNRAALPEYLDLLVEDLDKMELDAGLLIDGGICNPAVLAQVMPISQIICLARPEHTSAEIWNENDARIWHEEDNLSIAKTRRNVAKIHRVRRTHHPNNITGMPGKQNYSLSKN